MDGRNVSTFGVEAISERVAVCWETTVITIWLHNVRGHVIEDPRLAKCWAQQDWSISTAWLSVPAPPERVSLFPPLPLWLDFCSLPFLFLFSLSSSFTFLSLFHSPSPISLVLPPSLSFWKITSSLWEETKKINTMFPPSILQLNQNNRRTFRLKTSEEAWELRGCVKGELM